MWIVYFLLLFTTVQGETPKFRILAPEFVCPKSEGTPIDVPDSTIITLQTAAGSDFDIVWTVRWTPLTAPSQRLTLLLWKTVRELEKKLNQRQPEPFVYIIENEKLLNGVDYIFNISAVEVDGTVSSPKSFHIDNTQGDKKLDFVEGRSDLLSIVLVGAQETFADIDIEIAALVTTCFPTQDYYFIWTIQSSSTVDVAIDLSLTNGSRLVIPAYTLLAGQEYDVNCQVIKLSSGLRITQTGLPFQVRHRGLQIFFGSDFLMLPVHQPFGLETKVINHDYFGEEVNYNWECTDGEASCDFIDIFENHTLIFPSGFPSVGKYEVQVTASVRDQTAEANIFITVVEHTLPVIQITPMSRVLNEDGKMMLTANASNVAPTCTLAWYFAAQDLVALDSQTNSTCEDCQHGEVLSDTLTIYSLEENFLNELADFTNETEWRQVSAEMAAKAGRARFVAQCGCSATFECETKGMVYADVNFEINESPKPGGVMISPESGVAMETIFRLSTLAVIDPDSPLQYSFYCRIGDEDTLLLGSFVEHRALETLLPYVVGGTLVWVEVCDSLGACFAGERKAITVAQGDGSTVDTLVMDAQGHIRRCEFMQLLNLVGGAIVTYTNADQQELKIKFLKDVLSGLPPNPQCLGIKQKEYHQFLSWLEAHDVDINSIKMSN